MIRFYARAPGAAPQFPQNRDPIMQNVNVPPQAAQDIEALLRGGLTDPRVANEQFPFDRPTLYGQRPADQPVNLGGGTPGTGGVVPRLIAADPPMIGVISFRVGLDGALGGSNARLGLSTVPPVNGLITPQRFLGEVVAEGVGAGNGLATLHLPLTPGEITPGQTVFVQWFVDDAGAVGGQAASSVVRWTYFCGRSGCRTPCGSADYNGDGFVDFFDAASYTEDFELGAAAADFNGDGFVDFFDFDAFMASFEVGC